MNITFRFQELDIWKRSSKISIELFELAQHLENQKQFRWAEQLRSSTLSITNNIAEGSGSSSNSEFAQFLNYSRRSIFETANILLQLKPHLPETANIEFILQELDQISRMVNGFRNSLT